MRAATVADIHIDNNWIAAFQGTVVALVGGAAVWLAQRLVGKAAWKTAVDAGANALIDQLQEERKEYQKIIAQMREEWAAERLQNAAERAQLRGDVVNLTQALEGLKHWMGRNGYPMPPMARSPTTPEQVMLVLEQPAKEQDDDD